MGLTVYEGGIAKYLGSALEIVERYGLGNHYRQRLNLVREELRLLFTKAPQKKDESPKQAELSQFLKKT